MPFQRGDIVEVPFTIPDTNKIVQHPAVIISNDEVFENDGIYICVKLTHSARRDRFTFEITNTMLVKPNEENTVQARCHLVTYILERHIIPNSHRNRMKPNAVDRLVDRITVTSLMLPEEA